MRPSSWAGSVIGRHVTDRRVTMQHLCDLCGRRCVAVHCSVNFVNLLHSVICLSVAGQLSGRWVATWGCCRRSQRPMWRYQHDNLLCLIRCQSDANRIFVSIRELSNCETAIMTTYSLHCAKPLNMFNFAARCYAHARPMTCAVSLWPSVCPSLCLWCSCILSKRINISSNVFHRRVAIPF